MFRPFRVGELVVGVAAVLALGVAGCTTSTAPGSSLLTTQQADTISEQVAYDVDAEIIGAATSGGTTAYSAPALRTPGMMTQPVCTPTRTPASPTDTDGDGVPDSVRFVLPSCVLNWVLETDTVRGTLDFLDPTKALADHAVTEIFTNVAFVRAFTLSGKSSSATWNGTRTLSGDSSTLHGNETNFRSDFVFRDGSTATHVKTWAVTFTADTPGSIHLDQALPSGSWNIAGTSSWTRGTNAYSLTLATSPALHYNASCTTPPRFDSGTLTVVVTKGSVTQTVTIQFTACGQYTVTRS